MTENVKMLSALLNIRCTDDELRRFRACAKAEGRSMSDWARTSLLDAIPVSQARVRRAWRDRRVEQESSEIVEMAASAAGEERDDG